MKSLATRILGVFGRVIWRSAVGLALGVIVMFWPLHGQVPPLIVKLQEPLGALLIVCFLGKALYDTLFFDRYWP